MVSYVEYLTCCVLMASGIVGSAMYIVGRVIVHFIGRKR